MNRTEKATCGICMEDIVEQGAMNSCKHDFCFTCIIRWSRTTNKCPLCKQRFSKIQKIQLNNPDLILSTITVVDRELDEEQESDEDSETYHVNGRSLRMTHSRLRRNDESSNRAASTNNTSRSFTTNLHATDDPELAVIVPSSQPALRSRITTYFQNSSTARPVTESSAELSSEMQSPSSSQSTKPVFKVENPLRKSVDRSASWHNSISHSPVNTNPCSQPPQCQSPYVRANSFTTLNSKQASNNTGSISSPSQQRMSFVDLRTSPSSQNSQNLQVYTTPNSKLMEAFTKNLPQQIPSPNSNSTLSAYTSTGSLVSSKRINQSRSYSVPLSTPQKQQFSGSTEAPIKKRKAMEDITNQTNKQFKQDLASNSQLILPSQGFTESSRRYKHRFYASEYLKQLLFPYYTSKVIDKESFKLITQNVCDQFLKEVSDEVLHTKPYMLSPNRKVRLKELLDSEFEFVTSNL